MLDLFFHLVFVFVFWAFTLIRAFYQRKAQRNRGKVEFREGRLYLLARLSIGIPFMLLFFAYLIRPSLLAWANLPLPVWARWTGVILGLTSLPLILWVQRALDDNFSTTLHVRDEHSLVTGGPYRWVRHPMYTVLYIHWIGIALITANWVIGGVPLLALTLIVASRLKKEEALMIEKFGDRYRWYMERTGRFFPRLSRSAIGGDWEAQGS